MKTLADFWLAYWSRNTSQDSNHSNLYYYLIYIGISLLSALLVFIRIVVITLKGIDLSRKLHHDMFSRIIRAPVNLFFDRVPLGRLINRFTSDLDLVDGVMPFGVGGILYYPISLLSKFIMCVIAGTKWVVPLMFVFIAMSFQIQRSYSRVFREVFSLSNYIFSF